MHQVRILRNPERERERARDRGDEFETQEHVPRAFVLPPRPEDSVPRTLREQIAAGAAGNPRNAAAAGISAKHAIHFGDRIHSLTPSTTLDERCLKFIKGLNPDHPDPPAVDEHYEYPDTKLLNPRPPSPTLPRGQNPRPAWMDHNIPIPKDYFMLPVKETRPRRTRRPRRNPDEDFDSDDDCARHIYRLHT